MNKNKINLNNFSEKSLWIYLSIFVGCLFITIGNLIYEGISFSVLFNGNTEDLTTFLLSILIFIVCIIAFFILGKSIINKKEQEKRELEEKEKKKANKLAKKQRKYGR